MLVSDWGDYLGLYLVVFLQLFSTFFIFLRHSRVGGDPDGNRSKAIAVST